MTGFFNDKDVKEELHKLCEKVVEGMRNTVKESSEEEKEKIHARAAVLKIRDLEFETHLFPTKVNHQATTTSTSPSPESATSTTTKRRLRLKTAEEVFNVAQELLEQAQHAGHTEIRTIGIRLTNLSVKEDQEEEEEEEEEGKTNKDLTKEEEEEVTCK
mgnify:CR=1 FL=1